MPYSGPPAYSPAGAVSYSGVPYRGTAPYGTDPVTGMALSDKSRVTAGLLQILPGFVFTLGGIGRLYAGHTTLGVVQIVATVVGWISFWCGFLLVLPFFVTAACWLWFVIDGFVLLVGNSTDGSGRLLRR